MVLAGKPRVRGGKRASHLNLKRMSPIALFEWPIIACYIDLIWILMLWIPQLIVGVRTGTIAQIYGDVWPLDRVLTEWVSLWSKLHCLFVSEHWLESSTDRGTLFDIITDMIDWNTIFTKSCTSEKLAILLQTLMKEIQIHTNKARSRMLRAPFTSRSMQVLNVDILISCYLSICYWSCHSARRSWICSPHRR